MPDRDNLSKSLKAPWKGALNAARQGTEVLAQFAAATTVKVIPEIINAPLMNNLLNQLCEILATSKKERPAVLQLPKDAESSRENLIAVKSADRVLIEIISGDIQSNQQLTERLYETYCLEIPRTMCLGVLAVKVPDLYASPEIAVESQKACEDKLKTLLSKTAQELAQNPSEPKLTKIKKPKRKKRKSQKELVNLAAPINLKGL